MIWIAPSEKGTDTAALEKRLWDASDQFRVNSGRITEVIEPYHGRILDPACGSGGMFVSSARFVSEHKRQAAAGQSPEEKRPKDYSGDPTRELSMHGVEKTDETGRLCRLNLAAHGLEGEIKHGGNINSYYDDPHDATGRFECGSGWCVCLTN
jgi:type I restriction enzyme M protein